jgi:hypothetical protein
MTEEKHRHVQEPKNGKTYGQIAMKMPLEILKHMNTIKAMLCWIKRLFSGKLLHVAASTSSLRNNLQFCTSHRDKEQPPLFIAPC